MIGSRSPLRKVVIVNTSDEGGGAERLSMTALDGFNKMGIETWLLVGHKKTDHPRVIPFYLSPFIDYRPYARKLDQAAIEWRRRAALWLGLEDFNFPYSHRILDLTGSPPDLVICHNLHGGYFDLRAISALSARVPVVMQIFDSWLFTGHCASGLGCMRWQTGCGNCPDLTIPPEIRRDATRFNWWRKRKIFRDARLYVSAESQWMLDRVRKSMLAPAVVDWKVIPSGVDLDVFSPGSQSDAREQLGLQPDANILLYVANHGPDNAFFKDIATIRQALRELAARAPNRTIELLAVGADAPREQAAPNVSIRWLGYIRSPVHLAGLYRAADMVVHSSIEESYGISPAEALACGTPVVMASRSGICEVVEDQRTGLAAPPRDPVKLADAIERLLDTPSLRATMSAAAAASAKSRFDSRTMIATLHAWCAQIHERWPVAP